MAIEYTKAFDVALRRNGKTVSQIISELGIRINYKPQDGDLVTLTRIIGAD